MNKISNLFSRYIGRVFLTLLLCLMSGSAWADIDCEYDITITPVGGSHVYDGSDHEYDKQAIISVKKNGNFIIENKICTFTNSLGSYSITLDLSGYSEWRTVWFVQKEYFVGDVLTITLNNVPKFRNIGYYSIDSGYFSTNVKRGEYNKYYVNFFGTQIPFYSPSGTTTNMSCNPNIVASTYTINPYLTINCSGLDAGQMQVSIHDETDNKDLAGPSNSLDKVEIPYGHQIRITPIVNGNPCGAFISWGDGSSANPRVIDSYTQNTTLNANFEEISDFTITCKDYGFLSSDGSVSLDLPESSFPGVDWSVDNGLTVSGGKISGTLPYGETIVTIKAKKCDIEKTCNSKITLIKSATPCTTK